MSFRVLVVCTGNICRSPLAERLLGAALDRRRPGAFTVSSAGTWGLAGEPMHPYAAEYLTGRGLDPGRFVARRLHPLLLDDAGLVLAATREHRAAVVQAAPALLGRAFTLPEFAALAEPGPDPAAVTAAAAARRGTVEIPDYDVADPVSADARLFAQVAAEVDRLCEQVAAALAP